jgi:hypothetical protein
LRLVDQQVLGRYGIAGLLVVAESP